MIKIKSLGKIYPTATSTRKRYYSLYLCPTCDDEFRVCDEKLSERTHDKCKVCGHKELKHGKTGTRLHNIWNGMRHRCDEKNSLRYPYHAGRDIRVCKKWKKSFIKFEKWALNNGYSDKLTIDRKNNDGNYKPSNCRWVTALTQARNTQLLRSTNTSGYRGVSLHKGRYDAYLTVNHVKINIGRFSSQINGAIARDKYIVRNGLEHTLNFPRSDYE